jgi:hypothetical protein
MRICISNLRVYAFAAQSGRCYYCHLPMWKENARRFARTYGITRAQAKPFRCTGEHLEAKRDGGGDEQENIVAACYYCNMMRHTSEVVRSPADHREFVQKQQRAGRWHDVEVSRKLLKLKPPTTPALRAALLRQEENVDGGTRVTRYALPITRALIL